MSGIKRITIGLIILVIDGVPVTLFGLFVMGFFDSFKEPDIGWRDNHQWTIKSSGGGPAWLNLAAALITVVIIFLLTLLVLWALSKIGGPLKAEVKGSISKFGGKLWITAAGLVGAFLAIALVGVGSVYLLAH